MNTTEYNLRVKLEKLGYTSNKGFTANFNKRIFEMIFYKKNKEVCAIPMSCFSSSAANNWKVICHYLNLN